MPCAAPPGRGAQGGGSLRSGGGRRRETSTEVQAREQAARQCEVRHLEVEVWAGGCVPHPVCLGKGAWTASPVEANGQAGGASQRHRVRQEESGVGGFKRGLATPQRFSTRGSQCQHQLGAEKVYIVRAGAPAPRPKQDLLRQKVCGGLWQSVRPRALRGVLRLTRV